MQQVKGKVGGKQDCSNTEPYQSRSFQKENKPKAKAAFHAPYSTRSLKK